MVEPGHFECPAILDHDGLVRLDDQAGTARARTGIDVGAAIDRCLAPCAGGIEPRVLRSRWGRVVQRKLGFRCIGTTADRLDLVGLEDDLAVFEDKAELLPVDSLERGRHLGCICHRDREGRIRALIAKMSTVQHLGLRSIHALRTHLGEHAGGKFVAYRVERRQCFGKRPRNRPLAGGADIGKTHPVGGQDAGKRMDQDRRDTERVRCQAGVLTTGATETGQRVMRDIVAALDTDLLDGIGHVLDRDGKEAIRHLFRRAAIADHRRHLLEGFPHGNGIQWLVAVWPENPREEFR